MSFNDETLMAYADGELDEATRTAVELAIKRDPALAARVRKHQALRANVFAAFAPIAHEPVPPRFQLPGQGQGQGAKVVQLHTARTERQEAANVRSWSWPGWSAIAATLVLGVLAGGLGLKALQDDPLVASGGDGAMRANGRLAEALGTQLAGAATGEVKLGISFVARDGNYCRSFVTGVAAGLACKDGTQWKIPVMAQAAPAADGAYRQAGSEMPPAVLEAIDHRINGRTLDANEEKAARAAGWQR